MAEPTIQLGGGNWAGKTDNLLGYYKEGERFYKQDFTFSRSTTGTYTDKDGYIQEMPYNLLQQSNNFDTTWTLSAGIDLTSAQSGYDGSNAWLLKRNTTGARYVQQTLIRPSGQYSFSVYLKAESTDWVYVWAYDGSTTVNAYFDLNNGVVGNTSGLDSTNVVSVGNDWYRCTITFTQAITSVRIYPAYANGSIATGTDNGIYIQNAQLVKGTTAKTYFPTTTRLNMPRVDYLNNSNGSLILEPQRSNLVTYSSDFSNAAWVKYAVGVGITPIVTPNYAISPDGTQNASRLQCDLNGGNTISDRSWLYQTTTTISGDNTLSLYVKNNSNEEITFTLSNGSSETVVVLSDSKWHRLSTVRSGGGQPRIGLIGGVGASDTADLLIYGAQLEAGSYATSYIPTSGSSVTRNADVCNGGGDASRFNDNEGVLYAEIAALSDDSNERFLSISDGTTANRISLWYYSATNGLAIAVYSGSVAQFFTTTILSNDTDYNKIGIKYKANDFALWVNGVEIATDTSGLAPVGLSELAFDRGDGALDFYGKVKQIQYYNTALSNSELATLTTL